ncbi:MAG: glycerate kinase [Verrucomicrobia bacterium]|nr:glycerate kinase [Verrucomicrobiota bacterium]
MHILIAPDKFKGTLTAGQAAEAMAAGWRAVRPHDTLERFPISDGGDGFGELIGQHLGAETHWVDTVDAAHQPVRAPWWWYGRRKLAIIESVRVIGLAMLPPGRFHPFDLDTYGLGALLRAARRFSPRTCLVGIGGSATNDAGFGLARALGWQFQNRRGGPIEQWTQLPSLARLVRPAEPLRFNRLVVAVDVRNRLLGKYGATQVYGPQKGLQPADFKPAERCLRRLVKILCEQLHYSYKPEHLPGTGAAGGLGFGLFCFAGGRLQPGFKLFATHTDLRRHIEAADLVLTGEGAIDRTTVWMGKGVGRLARMAKKADIPCLALAGGVEAWPSQPDDFTLLRAIVPDLAEVSEAKRRAAYWLEELARRTAREWGEREHGAAAAPVG